MVLNYITHRAPANTGTGNNYKPTSPGKHRTGQVTNYIPTIPCNTGQVTTYITQRAPATQD
ncbi:unnamed protein product, partial [Coregonus sp. 'balchen']